VDRDFGLLARQVWCLPGLVIASCRRVELGHQFAVGCAGGGEVLLVILGLETQIGDVLFEGLVLVLECVDVGGGAEPGFVPGLFAEQAGEAAFKVLDASGEAHGSLLGVEQVCLQ